METNNVVRLSPSSEKSASGLQMVLGMKRFAVAILAMVVVSGCGVGADEYWDGEKLVSSQSQGLEQNPADAPVLPGTPPQTHGPQAPGTSGTSPGRDPSTVALPQDPIPVFEGKPVPQTPPSMDPSFDPRLGFSPRPGGL